VPRWKKTVRKTIGPYRTRRASTAGSLEVSGHAVTTGRRRQWGHRRRLSDDGRAADAKKSPIRGYRPKTIGTDKVYDTRVYTPCVCTTRAILKRISTMETSRYWNGSIYIPFTLRLRRDVYEKFSRFSSPSHTHTHSLCAPIHAYLRVFSLPFGNA